ncbi:hypothetical protein BFW87_25405 [Pseudomonas fluorescens]|uniref:Adhesin n=1 Tax=Pseudomonas fluorescens TaxID=294 RepID=A0A1T2Y206_PSEFL|nr:CS1 type fimbrial major subunit [Pseudomonas fluorescens]OPA86092.1 hypothetical protein BFW87_25405 [Pseudomonas fluorescens]
MVDRAVWLSIAVFMLMGSSAHAAREVREFDVFLDIPKPIFYVVPVEIDWIQNSQYLKWDPISSTLASLRKEFDVRNNSGAITASLLAKPVLSNGIAGQEIALAVTFNDVTLSEVGDREAVSAADARLGSRVMLEIMPVKPANGYRPGQYYGSVNMLFNAVAPL